MLVVCVKELRFRVIYVWNCSSLLGLAILTCIVSHLCSVYLYMYFCDLVHFSLILTLILSLPLIVILLQGKIIVLIIKCFVCHSLTFCLENPRFLTDCIILVCLFFPLSVMLSHRYLFVCTLIILSISNLIFLTLAQPFHGKQKSKRKENIRKFNNDRYNYQRL